MPPRSRPAPGLCALDQFQTTAITMKTRKFCPHCGRPVVRPEPRAMPSSATPAMRTSTVSRCLTRVGFRWCANCAASNGSAGSIPPPEDRGIPARRNRHLRQLPAERGVRLPDYPGRRQERRTRKLLGVLRGFRSRTARRRMPGYDRRSDRPQKRTRTRRTSARLRAGTAVSGVRIIHSINR